MLLTRNYRSRVFNEDLSLEPVGRAIKMITLLIALITIVLGYWYGTRSYKYWEERGIKHDKPLPFVGTNAKNYFMLLSYTQTVADVYRRYPNEKVVGFYRATIPELIIRDPDIVKRILVTDFPYFYERGLIPKCSLIEPLFRNLFFVDGDMWKLLRQRLTPAFTSGKLKAMFPLVCERADALKAVITAASNGKPHIFDARDLMARYTTDFIGSVGFGIQPDTLKDDDSPFRRLGREIFKTTMPVFLTVVLKELFPETFKHAKYMYRIEKNLIDLVKDILKQRNYAPSGRNDFIDVLLECKSKGTIVADSFEKFKADGTPESVSVELDDHLMAAQCFMFFSAGFETSSSATSYTLHQLAFNPEVQKKVQSEVDTVLAKYDNKLCYDAVREMAYLEWTLQESMRIFPSVGFLTRKCAKKFTIPELGISIDPETSVVIPTQAIHTDPQNFDNPYEFRPERFNPENVNPKIKFLHLPFGGGPRRCIGERLGLMQSIAGLAAVMSKFTVSPAPQSVREPALHPRSCVVQNIYGGLPLIFEERQVGKCS